jgi:hypothetical protein
MTAREWKGERRLTLTSLIHDGSILGRSASVVKRADARIAILHAALIGGSVQTINNKRVFD